MIFNINSTRGHTGSLLVVTTQEHIHAETFRDHMNLWYTVRDEHNTGDISVSRRNFGRDVIIRNMCLLVEFGMILRARKLSAGPTIETLKCSRTTVFAILNCIIDTSEVYNYVQAC